MEKRTVITLTHLVPCAGGCGRFVERAIYRKTGICDVCRGERAMERYREQKKAGGNPYPPSPRLTREQSDAREKSIVEMRMQEMTLAEIGASFSPPLSRERVRQILRRAETRHGMVIPRRFPASRVERSCGWKNCDKKVEVKGERLKKSDVSYCSREHMALARRKYFNKDDSPMTRKEINRYRYHHDEKRRQNMAEANRRYLQKKKEARRIAETPYRRV